MKILFCKISSMKYYKGHCRTDVPVNGGQFIKDTGYGHEEYNFYPFPSKDGKTKECIGFVEPKSYHGNRNTLHIEKIDGCKAMKNEDSVDDVLVVWCATRLQGDTTVVGWYKHATVFRELHEWPSPFSDSKGDIRVYNFLANLQNCVLLPSDERNRYYWGVPSARNNGYGFGQAMIWYPTKPEAKNYLTRLVEHIDNYDGENWINEGPKQNNL